MRRERDGGRMRRGLAVLLTALLCLLPARAAAGEARAPRILVAYFSATGNTRTVAEIAAELLGADLYEIAAADPYTEEDLAYYTGGRCDLEQADPSVRPAISGEVGDVARYDAVLIGHPIWHGQAPRIISTFLESYDFGGKALATFCTSASSGLGSSAEELRSLVPEDVTWLNSRRFPAGADAESVAEWLDTDIRPYLEERMKETEMKLSIDGAGVTVAWEDSDAAAALAGRVREGALTVRLSMYGGFEQVGPLGMDLPRQDARITTVPGDIVLYSGDQIVIFYGSNSWEYTRLGHIDSTPEEMRELLGDHDVSITLSPD